jgi:hypothetical protein
MGRRKSAVASSIVLIACALRAQIVEREAPRYGASLALQKFYPIVRELRACQVFLRSVVRSWRFLGMLGRAIRGPPHAREFRGWTLDVTLCLPSSLR